MLVLDAFSSDSIPMHLLTKEAFDIYLKHLRPDGAIAVHISNRHLESGAGRVRSGRTASAWRRGESSRST